MQLALHTRSVDAHKNLPTQGCPHGPREQANRSLSVNTLGWVHRGHAGATGTEPTGAPWRQGEAVHQRARGPGPALEHPPRRVLQDALLTR